MLTPIHGTKKGSDCTKEVNAANHSSLNSDVPAEAVVEEGHTKFEDKVCSSKPCDNLLDESRTEKQPVGTV